MKTRQLSGGLSVSALGLGCMGMSEFYGPRDDVQSMRVLHRALDLGVTFFDTADMYGPHHNEELIGRFLRERGREVTLATKFGIVRDGNTYTRSIDNSPDYIRRACDASLQRLGVERIDLYYVHRVDTATPIEQTMEALAGLVREGKIVHVGLCEVSAETLRRAHVVHPVAAVQTEYSLWARDVEAQVLRACRELGVGFVAYSPLGRGFLTGAFTAATTFEESDFRARLPRFQSDTLRTNRPIADLVAALSVQKGCTPAQFALAWLMAQGKDIVPIPGTTRLNHLDDNAAAVDIMVSTDEDRALRNALAQTPAAGARYTDEGMKGVNV